MLCHRQFLAMAAFMALLALLPPAIHLFLQQKPAAKTVDLSFWLIRPWGKEGRQLRSLSLSYLDACLREDDFKRMLEQNIGIPTPFQIASIDMLTCHEGNEVNGDARAIVAATSPTRTGKFSCEIVPKDRWSFHDGRTSELCVTLKDYDVNLFNARVQFWLWEDFENVTDPHRWTPVTLDSYRYVMDMVGDAPLPPLLITNCDERVASLRHNKCLKGNRASFVGLQHTLVEEWHPKEIVVQFQIRMLRSFKAGKEGGPGTVRLFQRLSASSPALPGAIEVSVDWNRMGRSNEVPTVWVNFRTENATTPVASYTFHARILEDCRSHVVTVHLRLIGLGSLYIDGFERGRFAMVGTPPSRVQAMMTSARWAGVAWFNASTGSALVTTPAVDGEDVTLKEPTRSGLLHGETEKDRTFLKPFFLTPYVAVVVSGWGVTQIANGETMFEALPWSFDNIFVGESLSQAKRLMAATLPAIAHEEAKLPICPYQPYLSVIP